MIANLKLFGPIFVVYTVSVGHSMENCLFWCVVNYSLAYHMYAAQPKSYRPTPVNTSRMGDGSSFKVRSI